MKVAQGKKRFSDTSEERMAYNDRPADVLFCFVLCFVFAVCNSRILVLSKRFSTASIYKTEEGRATPVQLEVGARFDFSMVTAVGQPWDIP